MAQAQQQAANTQQRSIITRPENQEEPATWLLENGECAPVKQVRLRSVQSIVDSIIEFKNDSDVPARATWLDFNGNEVQYTVIDPKSTRRYRTYASHPWIMRDASTGHRMMLADRMVFVASEETHKVVIKAAPPLQWSLDSYKHFPAEFKATTKAVLMCHHRLRHSDAHLTPSLGISNHYLHQHDGDVSMASEPELVGPTTSFGWATASPFQAAYDTKPSEPFHSFDPMDVDCPPCMRTCLDACYPRASSVLPAASSVPSLLSTMSSTLDDVDMTDAGSTVTSIAPSTSVTPSSSFATLFTLGNGPSGGAGNMQQRVIGRLGHGSALGTSHDHGPSRFAFASTAARDGNADLPVFSSALEPHSLAPMSVFASTNSLQSLAARTVAHQAQHASVQPAQQAQQQQRLVMPTSPRTLHRAARMLGWVVDKVVRVVRSPLRAPKPLTPMAKNSKQRKVAEVMATPTLLEGLVDLPQHLVIYILELTAPKDVLQCVSHGPAESRPDIQPAMLLSDPAAWPAPPAPPQELVQQQQQAQQQPQQAAAMQ